MTRAPVSFALIRATAKYYWRTHRWRALVRALALTTLWRYGYELCQECGNRWSGRWHAPDALWAELVNTDGHGLLCPSCFERKAARSGYWLRWTPMVAMKNGVPTTNWWHDDTRDALLIGEPDPECWDHDRSIDKPQQRTWAAIAQQNRAA